MPSPFPGMDPYLENQEWNDFHARAIIVISELLTPLLPARYIARAERRIYFGDDLDDAISFTTGVPDAAVLEISDGAGPYGRASAATASTLAVPVRRRWPKKVEHHETWLEIREGDTKRVVTVIELLSPANKAPGHKGRRLYLRKRDKARASRTHFVEIDLLRGGKSVAPVRPLPEGDYYALVARAWRQSVDLYAWGLRDPLPTIAIPLRKADGDVPLDLQQVLTTCYDRSLYGRSLDYAALLRPALSVEDEAWKNDVLGDASGSGD